MLRLKRHLSVFSAAAFALGLFGFAALPLAAQDAASPESGIKLPVKVVFFPIREALIAPNVSATIKEYKYKVGESFVANALVVQLEDRQYQQAFMRAKAQAEEAKAVFTFATDTYKRNLELFDKNTIGFQEMSQSRLEKETSEAKLNFAVASQKMAEFDLDSCAIKAPFNGKVTKRAAKENEFVKAGEPFLELVDDSELLADMHLPSSLRPSIKLGDELEIKVDETGTLCKGKVYELSGRIDYESRTFEVKAVVPNKDGKLSAGMSGTLVEGAR